MKKLHLFKTVLLLCALMVGSGSAWAAEVTYSIDSKGKVTTTGTAPTGSSLSFTNTYTSDYRQMTSGNSQTWTFSNYGGLNITKLVLSMKSNSKKGGGSLSYSVDGGDSYSDIVSESKFNTNNWYGAWTTSFVDITKNVDITTGDEDFVLVFSSSESSIYCQSVKITYEEASSDLEDSDLALVDAPVALSFDLYNDKTKEISYTTSSTGAVTVVENDYVDAVVDAVNKKITLTAKKVTASTQTITVNQAADESYKSGSTTFTVSIEDSTPFVGGDVTFVGGTDTGTSTSQSADEVTKSVVTIASDKAGFAYAEYRIYSGSTTTISTSTGKITKIVFTQASGSYPLSNLSVSAGDGTYSAGTWTGCASSVSFDADGQARASKIVVTVCPTVTLNSYGFSSYCSPFALDLTPNSEFAAYAVAAAGDNALTFTKIPGKVAKETPIILYNPDKAGEAVCLPIIEDDDEDIEAVTGNELIGTLAPTSVTDVDGHTNFGLKGNKFVKFNAGTVAANKAYLCVDNSKISAEARELSIIFDDGETTGITEMKNIQSESRGGIYNLNGQLVDQPAKGLYIMNGKKVIIK